MPASLHTFACPTCGQQFAWLPRLAGRKLACACGDVLTVPASLNGAPDSYELAAESAPAPPSQIQLTTDVASDARPAPVLSYDMITARQQSRLGGGIESPFRDFWLPIALIGLSTVVLTLLCIQVCRHSTAPTTEVIANFSMRLGWDLCVTAVVGVFVAWLLGTALGVLPVAVLKLTAAAMVRFTLWAIFGMTIRHVGGDIAGFLLSLPAFIFLFSYFFELDGREAFFAVALITLLRWVSYFGLWKIL